MAIAHELVREFVEDNQGFFGEEEPIYPRTPLSSLLEGERQSLRSTRVSLLGFGDPGLTQRMVELAEQESGGNDINVFKGIQEFHSLVSVDQRQKNTVVLADPLFEDGYEQGWNRLDEILAIAQDALGQQSKLVVSVPLPEGKNLESRLARTHGFFTSREWLIGGWTLPPQAGLVESYEEPFLVYYLFPGRSAITSLVGDLRTIQPGFYPRLIIDGSPVEVRTCWLERPFQSLLGIPMKAGEDLTIGLAAFALDEQGHILDSLAISSSIGANTRVKNRVAWEFRNERAAQEFLKLRRAAPYWDALPNQ